MRFSKFTLIGILSILAAPVAAQTPNLRDLTVEQSAAAQAGTSRPSSLQVAVAVDRQDATYAIGEAVHLTLSTNEDAYVTVLDVGPTGQVTQLFPNLYQSDNRVLANQQIEIAGGATGVRVVVSEPVGAELIKVIASSKPLAVVAEGQLTQGRGVFRSVDGGVGAVVRDLQVVADKASENDAKIVFSNFAVHTISARLSAAPAEQTIVVTPAPPVPVATTIQQDQSLQGQFVPDSFTLEASAIASKFNWSWNTTISYSITNDSGLNLYLGIMKGGVAIGRCTDAEEARGSLQFLPSPHATAYSVNPTQGPPRGAFVPAGARAAGAIVMHNCPAPNPGYPTAQLSLSLMVGKSEAFQTMTTFPLSVNAPVRQLQSQ